MEHLAGLTQNTVAVTTFMPATTVPFLAWAAILAETILGFALVLGIRPRRTAFAAAALLAVSGTVVAIAMGFRSPLDHAVFSASAAAVLLAPGQPTDAASWPPSALRRWWARLPRLRHGDDLARGVIGLL